MLINHGEPVMSPEGAAALAAVYEAATDSCGVAAGTEDDVGYGDDGASGDPSTGARPEIRMRADKLHETIMQTVVALAAGDPDLYQHGGMLVHLAPTERSGAPSIRAIPAAALRERLARSASFLKYLKKDECWRPCEPPVEITKGIHDRGNWPGIKRLVGIVTSPVMRVDGTVFDTHGYDAKTSLYYHRSTAFPAVPESPTRADARAALAILAAPFSQVPFASQAHQSAAISIILSGVCRSAIDGPVPGYVIEANTRAAGKSQLAACIGRIVAGEEPPAATFSTDKNEQPKIILAELLEGKQIMWFDDVSGTIMGADLNRLLTAATFSGRLLGVSRILCFKVRQLILFTANNAAVGRDVGRRLLLVRLNSPAEHPEDLDGFLIRNLRKYCSDHRPTLVVAALTVIRAWYAAGQPDQALKSLGSFEEWTRVVRNAMVWAGWPDPLDTQVALRADEAEDLAPLACFHDALERMCSANDGAVTGQQIAAAANGKMYGLDEALSELPGKPIDGPWKATAVGYRLRPHKDRVVDGRRLVTMLGKGREGSRWKIQAVLP